MAEYDTTPVQDVLKNKTTREALEKNIGARVEHQQIVGQTKPGQKPAEEAVGVQGKSLPDDPLERSKSLMGLVELTRYDDVSSEDVTKLARGGTDLSDQQMWDLVAGNARFMENNIKQGLTINKILPDDSIKTILEHKQSWVMMDNGVPRKDNNGNVIKGTKLGGSVADEKYYQGLSGEQAIANFGLDYGGYSAGTVKHDMTDGSGGKHSSYVSDAAPDSEGRMLKGVPNVFFVQAKVPDTSLPDVKVPVHANVDKWAKDKLAEVSFAINDPTTLKELADKAGVTTDEMRTSLQRKEQTLKTFVANAKVDTGMTTTLSPDKNNPGAYVKNKEDPLTNMGMTKPSNRLQTDFQTINQEYHIDSSKMFVVPEGSKLYMKGSNGKDVEIGEMVKNSSGQLEFGNLKTDLIDKTLKENQAVRESLELHSGLKHVEPTVKSSVQVQESTDIMKQKLNLNRVPETEKQLPQQELAEFQTTKLKSAPKVESEKPKEELAEFQKVKLKSVRDSLGKTGEKPKVEVNSNSRSIK